MPATNSRGAAGSSALCSRSGSTWCGVAVGVTLLPRYLTGTYFVFIFAGLAACTLLRPPDRRLRFLKLLRAAGNATVIAGPIFWLNYEMVREYYWIGHYVGPESTIRNHQRSVLCVQFGRFGLAPFSDSVQPSLV